MSCFCTWICPEESYIPTKTMIVFPTNRLNEFVVFITYYTFDVDLMDFCSFRLRTIFYKKVVLAMWPPLRDQIVGYHIKQVIACNNNKFSVTVVTCIFCLNLFFSDRSSNGYVCFFQFGYFNILCVLLNKTTSSADLYVIYFLCSLHATFNGYI